jgi:putative SOS response-associated peptidase YedK
MCGRFTLFDEREIKEINQIISELEEEQRRTIKTGEICPTDKVPILIRRGEMQVSEVVAWGFPHFKGSGVIINARSETAHTKSMFANSMVNGRCIIPSTGFYEWSHENNKTRQKYLFNLADDPVLYMAGLIGDFGNEKRFIILTTQANASIQGIHDRMPVVLNRSELDDWISSAAAAREILRDHSRRPLLVSREAK